MFKSASRLYGNLLCSVGGGKAGTKPRIFGYGCILSRRHVATVFHVTQEMQRRRFELFAFPLSIGPVRCRRVYGDEETDIAIIEAEADLEKNGASFPEIAVDDLEIGTSLGYITRLWKMKPGSTEQGVYTYFSSASVSFLGENELGQDRWVLSGGLIESGFSGSPAFTPDRRLVGLIVGASCMNATIEGLPPLPVYFPQVSSIASLPLDTRNGIASAQ